MQVYDLSADEPYTCNFITEVIAMACFIVPAAEAIITSIASKAIKSKEVKAETVTAACDDGIEVSVKIPFSRKLRWLSNLLWGGSVLLAFEHVWHGEVEPFFPFLTSAASAQGAVSMLREMATVGVTMAVLVTALWCVMLAVSAAIERKAAKQLER